MPATPTRADALRIYSELLAEAHQRIRDLQAQLARMSAAQVVADGGLHAAAGGNTFQRRRALALGRAGKRAVRTTTLWADTEPTRGER